VGRKREKPGLGRVEELEKEVKDLKKKVRRLEKELSTAKSDKKTMNTAWKKTREFLHQKTDNHTLNELLEDAKHGALRTEEVDDNECPQCHSDKLKKVKCPGFTLNTCPCGYSLKVPHVN